MISGDTQGRVLIYNMRMHFLPWTTKIPNIKNSFFAYGQIYITLCNSSLQWTPGSYFCKLRNATKLTFSFRARHPKHRHLCWYPTDIFLGRISGNKCNNCKRCGIWKQCNSGFLIIKIAQKNREFWKIAIVVNSQECQDLTVGASSTTRYGMNNIF